MRTLEPAPSSFYDADGRPRFGSYRGALPEVDLAPLATGRLDLVTKKKRWVYVALANERYYAAVAAVHAGYAATTFAFLYEHGNGMLFDASAMGLPVGQRFTAPLGVSFRGAFAEVRIDAGAG
ncbi:MAG TPA: DUF2804 family protein, partial [Minicystis sp.]|nr:DUF2804 family protein [Minicystis sp.]